MFNKVILVGRIGNDLIISESKNGFFYCRMSIVTNEKYTNKDGQKIEDSQWHSVKIYGKQAENAVKYVGKGCLINVSGKIKYSKYADKDGNEKNGVEIIADDVNFIEFKKE